MVDFMMGDPTMKDYRNHQIANQQCSNCIPIEPLFRMPHAMEWPTELHGDSNRSRGRAEGRTRGHR